MTAYAAVIGDPVAHSLSPAIHNAAFAALGIDARYEAVTVAPADLGDVMRRMRDERWLGMSVTMPHKIAVVDHLDALTPIAQRLGAVNCVFWDGDRLVGDNTDGAGLIWAFGQLGVDVAGKNVVVLGAGGAASACARALVDAGAHEITLVNRTQIRAAELAGATGPPARVGTASDLPTADIVVNATSMGMGAIGPDQQLIPGKGVVAMDLVYHPLEGAWLAAARSRGATGANGVGMLVGQAAVAFERWTGRSAPTDVMLAAVGTALTT